MIYKTPFYAVSKALYKTLSDMTIEWFDVSVPPEDIADHFKSQMEYCFGILAEGTADCDSNKDTAIWTNSIRVEIYSNYRGRKVIADKLEELLNLLSNQGGWNNLDETLNQEGFTLIKIDINQLRIGSPAYTESGTWQNASADIILQIQQKE